MSGSGYKINFNQDFTSISVLSKTGYRLYTIASIDKVDEIYAKENENIRIVERLFNSSLVVLVTEAKPNCLKMLHFKKKQDICNCVYPSTILCVRMNRYRLVVCLAESIHIHDIRDMKILHSIENIAPNELGLCSLSLNSHLAYPTSSGTSGELRIFNANKLKSGLTIKAHETALSAISFSSNGVLIATASERGTVIRVFCVKNGQRVQEFRRGVKRCVRIASLVFSANADFICASSNTETVHIFKIDSKAVEASERKSIVVDGSGIVVGSSSLEDLENKPKPAGKTKHRSSVPAQGSAPEPAIAAPSLPLPSTAADDVNSGGGGSSWSGYISKAVSSYFPSQVCDVLNQDRAFATAVLSQPGLMHVCGLARVQKELKLLVACQDGFLYIHEFNDSKGGNCKLLRVHDLRSTLEGVIELNLTESMDKLPMPTTQTPPQTKSTVVIESPEAVPDNSYAGILKGDQVANNLTESAKYRSLCDAIDSPAKIFDERQFPPVVAASAVKD